MRSAVGPRGSACLGLLCCSGLLAAPCSTMAYVRTRTSSCQPLAWQQSCVYIQADHDYVGDLPSADIEEAIKDAIDSWQTLTNPGSFLLLKHLPADKPRETLASDGLQVIKFRPAKWCRPARSGAAAVCYDPSALAITTVTYMTKPGSARDGQILDADIELNAAHVRFTRLAPGQPGGAPSPGDPRPPVDLWNTLTHELGHLQGLDHVCSSASDVDTQCTVDDQGLPRPLCIDVANQQSGNLRYAAIAGAAMSGITELQETRKRVPQADDVHAIVDAYPVRNDPNHCPSPEGSAGCAAIAARAEAPVWAFAALGALGLGLSLFRRRRQRRTR